MNAKSRRRVLNVAFKKFQRLPDWAPVKMISERPAADSPPKYQVPPAIYQAPPANTSRSLAE
jgi:hypothetical protein